MSFLKCSIGIFLSDASNKLTWTNSIGVYTKDGLTQIDLKVVSATFYSFFFKSKMRTLVKLGKMFFISLQKLFSFLRK